AARPHRVEQGDGEPLGGEHGEEVLPVVARGLHGDEQVLRAPEEGPQGLVARGILPEGGGVDEQRPVLVHEGGGGELARDADPGEAHRPPSRRGNPGASMPVPLLVLVHARTPQAPRDTVRALNTGRGRDSSLRGLGLKHSAATLSRCPPLTLYTRWRT